MNFQNLDVTEVPDAQAGLEAWLETIRSPAGYYGPVVGTRGHSVRYCGPAFDWRCEGLLDGHGKMYRATGDDSYLDRTEVDLGNIRAAQLLNGTFRNSWFEFNPFEGGMPHEPAVMAAVCRARRLLAEAERPVQPELDDMLERYVDRHLIHELWNRMLHTFNDWLQSDFENYTPHAVAAAIELLIEYADVTDDWKRLEHYVVGAADSLLDVQDEHGAIPLSNRRGSAVCPAFAARCVPALLAAAERTGTEKYQKAAEALLHFVRQQARPEGGFTYLVLQGRPNALRPDITGATAGALNALSRAGVLEEQDLSLQIPYILARQMENGAFSTATGFGDSTCRASLHDWRDVLPVCGWIDKIYCLLADVHPGTTGQFTATSVTRTVTVKRRRAEYTENTGTIEIRRIGGEQLFLWKKGARWASVCSL